jgi:hypothetical protein
MEDAARPCFEGSDGIVGCYPPIPVAGGEFYLLRAEKPENGSPWSITLPNGDTRILPNTGENSSTVVGRMTAGDEGKLIVSESPGGAVLRTLQVARPILSEDVDLRMDSRFLERLAESGGGAYAPIEKIRPMLAAIEPRTARDVHVTEWRIWNSTLLMIALAVLLTVDWIVRRRSGMVL